MTDTPATLSPTLRDAALRWIADDVDADARAELQGVLARAMVGERDAIADVADRMSGPLTFGTAGLRGPVRAGPNGMNVAVVVRTTAGVAAWLRTRAAGGTIVVGRDARHGSERFASAAAEVLTAAGFDVRVFPDAVPTPLLAFAVRELGAVAGIQITASHNPPSDNGYKLYDDSGAQIIPPADTEIEGEAAAVPAAVSVPRAAGARPVGDEVRERYLDRVTALPRGTARELRVAATPLHGVGGDVLSEALRRAGFPDVHLVAEQSAPDPAFPTVSFPNPEEPGATDMLLAHAAEIDADLAVALDPDADRCAIGARDRDGTWRMLTGDEAGVLLGDHLLSHLDRADALVATTIVSSSMLASIASAHGARYTETLTGFKWLARAGDGLVYAYEEALGICVDPAAVRDKDGIAAAVLACDLAAATRASGGTLFDTLDDLTVRHGVHLTEQISVRFADLGQRTELMARLRSTPPDAVAGVPVESEDLLPDADVLRLRGDGMRVVIRPSGTEPKLKTYLEVTAPVASESDLAAAREAATARLAAVRGAVRRLLE